MAIYNSNLNDLNSTKYKMYRNFYFGLFLGPRHTTHFYAQYWNKKLKDIAIKRLKDIAIKRLKDIAIIRLKDIAIKR